MRKLIESLFGAIQIAGHLLLYPLLRGWRRRWGTTEEERALRLPGDELVSEPQWTYNHAISIDAPRSAVWPWLVQLGAGGAAASTPTRGSRTWSAARFATSIRPELQELCVGETITELVEAAESRDE